MDSLIHILINAHLVGLIQTHVVPLKVDGKPFLKHSIILGGKV